MKRFNNFILIIFLLPLIITLIVASFNLNKKSKINFLIWETEPLNFGLVLALGSIIGASVSSLSIILQNQNISTKRRTTRMSYNNSIYSDEFNDHNESQSLEVQEEENYTYIERDIRDPSPTLSVPFKIIKNKSKQYDDYNRGSYSPKDIRKNNESMQQPAQQSISYDDIDNDSDSDSDSDWMSTNYDQW